MAFPTGSISFRFGMAYSLFHLEFAVIKGIVVVLLVSVTQLVPGLSLLSSGEKSVDAYHSRIAKAVGE